jgi:hypothetical protein
MEGAFTKLATPTPSCRSNFEGKVCLVGWRWEPWAGHPRVLKHMDRTRLGPHGCGFGSSDFDI